MKNLNLEENIQNHQRKSQKRIREEEEEEEDDDDDDENEDLNSELMDRWMKSSKDWSRAYREKLKFCLENDLAPINPIDCYRDINRTSRKKPSQIDRSTRSVSEDYGNEILGGSNGFDQDDDDEEEQEQEQEQEKSSDDNILVDETVIEPKGLENILDCKGELMMNTNEDERQKSPISEPADPQKNLIQESSVLAPLIPSPEISSEQKKDRYKTHDHENDTRNLTGDDSPVKQNSEGDILQDNNDFDGLKETSSNSLAENAEDDRSDLNDLSNTRQRRVSSKDGEKAPGRKINGRKQVMTLEKYDKMIVKERNKRFPELRGFVNFLREALGDGPRRRKSLKLDLRGYKVFYILNRKIRDRLNDSDRQKIRKLMEANASILTEDDLSSLLSGGDNELEDLITHVIISEPVKKDFNQFRDLIKLSIPNNSILQEKILELCSFEQASSKTTTMDGSSNFRGKETSKVWLLDVTWLETCLTHQTIIPEKHMRLRFNSSNLSKSSSSSSSRNRLVEGGSDDPKKNKNKRRKLEGSDSQTDDDDDDDDESTDQSSRNNKNEESSVEKKQEGDDDEDEIETSVNLPRGLILSKKIQDDHDSGSKESLKGDWIGHGQAPIGLESQFRLACLGEVDTDEETTSNRSIEEEIEESESEDLNKKKNDSKSKKGLKECKKYSKGNGNGKRAYDCERSNVLRKDGPNEDICQKLEEILKLYGNNPNDSFRVLNLRKSIGVLRSMNRRVEDEKSLINIKGIGKKTAQKIIEIIRTGSHRRLELMTEEDKVRNLFMGIYGVGKVLAVKWYRNGFKSLEDLKDQSLSEPQKIGLKFYDDLQERIPRKEVELIFQKILSIAKQIDQKLILELMGSYRRGEQTCGDIDIILTRDDSDGKTHEGVLKRLHKLLKKASIITYDLSMPSNINSLSAKYMGLCCLKEGSLVEAGNDRSLNGIGGKQRRIDILCVPYNQLGAAFIYFTGNDLFNRSMRLKARNLGYKLTNHGLFKRTSSSTCKISNENIRTIEDRDENYTRCLSIVGSNTEEEIFKILDVKYLPPHERNV